MCFFYFVQNTFFSGSGPLWEPKMKPQGFKSELKLTQKRFPTKMKKREFCLHILRFGGVGQPRKLGFSLLFSNIFGKLSEEASETTFYHVFCDFWAFRRLQLHHFWPPFSGSKFRGCAFLGFTFVLTFLTARKRIGGNLAEIPWLRSPEIPWLRSLG